MDLKSKLARLTAPVKAPPPPSNERIERVERLRGMLGKLIAEDRRRLRDRPPAAAPAPLPGELIDSAHGPLQRVQFFLEPKHTHGRIPIADALDVSPLTIARLALDTELTSIDPRRMLFLDTETTGLSGGTGTIPFLLGLAWFEDESLCVEQLILRKPGEEAPILHRLAERIAWASCIVSYNGKSFDWPLLRNRFVLNRVPVATPPAHLDLLHCARRVFARRLGNVRLVNLEAEVLGLRREADIDGAEIPALFWEYVRGEDGSKLAPVIEHNANDVVALAAILATLADRYDSLRPEHEPADQLGIASVAVRADDHERAVRYAHAAADGGGPSDVTVDALWLAAERIELLTRALNETVDDERTARIHLALSKIYEHRFKDYKLAIEHGQKSVPAEGVADRDHRIARIERKQARSA
jgi:uncharacterized protein YprB with RNaseH-like and TPR domain